MEILLCIAVFLLALDNQAFTKVLSRPLIACSIIGAILGNITTGVTVGAMLEVYYISCCVTDTYNNLTKGFLLVSIVSTILTSTESLDASSAVSTGYACILLGVTIAYVFNILNTIFLPLARKACEKGDSKQLGIATFVPVMIQGAVYAVIAYMMYINATVITETISTFINEHWYITNGLQAIVFLMPCISLAILLRNIGVKDVKGALLGGISSGMLFVISTSNYMSNVLIGLFALFVGWFDYYISSKNVTVVEPIKNEEIKVEEKKEESEKWW